MINIALKPNNVPTKPGTYIRSNSGGYPLLAVIKLVNWVGTNKPTLVVTTNGSSYVLEGLSSLVTWSDEISITQ